MDDNEYIREKMMEDIDKILFTSAVTILAGFLIHALSQLLMKLFIEPLQEYRKHASEAVMLLSFYSNMLSAKINEHDNKAYQDRYYRAQDEIRSCMANLQASYSMVSPKILGTFLRVLPEKEKHKKITKNMLTLSFLGELLTREDKASKNYDLATETQKMLGAS